MAVDITGKNYLSWVLDAEIHLGAKSLGETIKEGNKATSQDFKEIIFVRHHLHKTLKTEYLTVKDLQILWNNLKERYDLILRKARYDWLHLRLQDFTSLSEYNLAMFKITSQLTFCGEKVTGAKILEKTYSTFHANNVVLQTQYRDKGFTKYYELISCLLVAEQNNELLMKNHESRPTNLSLFPEANVTYHIDHADNNGQNRGHGCGRGSGRGYSGFGRGRGGYNRNSHSDWKWERKNGKNDKKINEDVTNTCYRCGGIGHWSRVCRAPKHLVALYKSSLKQKGKQIETNLVFEDGKGDIESSNATHLEVADFFTSQEGNASL